MQSTEKIASLILAAGSSSRMGTPKQLLPWKDTTLLSRAIGTAEASVVHDVYVVLGAHHDKIRPIISGGNSTIIHNKRWQEGLGSSIVSGIEYFGEHKKAYAAVLVLLCDQPLISPQYLNLLIQTFAENKKGIVATNYGNRAGVPAIFAKKYFNALMELQGDKGAKNLMERNGEDTIVLENGENLTDLDTRVEYEQLMKRLKD